MKGGGGNMFRKKIASNYAGTTPIVSGTFWKKGHGGIVGSNDWKKREYELYKSNDLYEPYFVLIYFLPDEKTEKGHIKFRFNNMYNENDKNKISDIKKSYFAELTDTLPGNSVQRRGEANDMAEGIKVINIIDNISGNNKKFPIFFETEADFNDFKSQIVGGTTSDVPAASDMSSQDGGSKNILKTRRRKHKRKTRRRKNKKRKSRTRSIRRQ